MRRTDRNVCITSAGLTLYSIYCRVTAVAGARTSLTRRIRSRYLSCNSVCRLCSEISAPSIRASCTFVGISRGSPSVTINVARFPTSSEGTVHPVTGPALVGGDVLITNGKISAIGPKLAIPAGARVIDVAGRHVYPGLIAANTRRSRGVAAGVPETRGLAVRAAGMTTASTRAERRGKRKRSIRGSV